jgi:drug/metabolite transporter (DMT)-like permease
VLRDRRSVLAAALVAVPAIMWGLWPTVLRPCGLPALQAILAIQVVQAAPAAVVGWRERAAFRDRGAVVALLLYGVLDAVQGVMYFRALQRGPLAVAALTHYLGPVMIALAAPFIPGERASRRAMVAAPLSLLGLRLVMGPWHDAPLETALLGAGSAVFGASSLFAVKRAGRSFSPLAVCSLHAAVSVAALLAVFGGAAIPPLGAGVAGLAAATLVLGIGASMIFVHAVKAVSASTASTITYVEPITAVVMGWLVAGERLGPGALVGAAVVIGGGVWVALEPVPAAPPADEAPRQAA